MHVRQFWKIIILDMSPTECECTADFYCLQLPDIPHSAVRADGPWTAMLRITMREKWQSWSQLRKTAVKMILREEFNYNMTHSEWVSYPQNSTLYCHSIPGSIQNELSEERSTQINPLGLPYAHLLATWHKAPISAHPGSLYTNDIWTWQKQMRTAHRLQPFPLPHSWPGPRRRLLFKRLTSRKIPGLKNRSCWCFCVA